MARDYGFLKKVVGISFIVIGVFGLFLPFLQGILFILAGIAILKSDKVEKFVEAKIE